MQIDRISTGDNLRLHRFLDPRIKDDLVFAGGTLLELERGGSSSGLGDIRIQAKYQLLDPEVGEGGLAVMVESSLPTGDDKEFLGAGAARARAAIVGSRLYSRWSPHFDLSHTVAIGDSDVFGDLPDESNLGVGVDFLANDRLTLSLDVLTRRQSGLTSFGTSEGSFPFALSASQNAARVGSGLAACTAAQPCFTGAAGSGTNFKPELTIDPNGDATLTRAALGLRFRPIRHAVVSTYFSFPLEDNGGLLDSDPVAHLGFDLSF
jgi:hypothetical protein